MNSMTIEEAKTIIDKLSSRDDSNKSNSEKRAKVLNKILNNYILLPENGSYITNHQYSLETIGYLLDTSKQYIRNVEIQAIKKLNKSLEDYN